MKKSQEYTQNPLKNQEKYAILLEHKIKRIGDIRMGKIISFAN
jgi:hypothetical protein